MKIEKIGVMVFNENENIEEIRNDLEKEVNVMQIISGNTVDYNGRIIPVISFVISGDWEHIFNIQLKYGIIKDYDNENVWYPSKFMENLAVC